MLAIITQVKDEEVDTGDAAAPKAIAELVQYTEQYLGGVKSGSHEALQRFTHRFASNHESATTP